MLSTLIGNGLHCLSRQRADLMTSQHHSRMTGYMDIHLESKKKFILCNKFCFKNIRAYLSTQTGALGKRSPLKTSLWKCRRACQDCLLWFLHGYFLLPSEIKFCTQIQLEHLAWFLRPGILKKHAFQVLWLLHIWILSGLNIQRPGWRGSEQLDLAVDIPDHCRGVRLDDL